MVVFGLHFGYMESEWQQRASNSHKVESIMIGGPEALNLAEARDKAAEIRVMIRAGRDPRIVKAETTAADATKREKAKHDSAPALDA